MQISSAKFIQGVVGDTAILDNGTPQIAFIGRSNAGKSSLLNSLTNSKKLAITSKTPGRTKEINVFLINNTHYFMDLPGYGYAKASGETLRKLSELIIWYLFESNNNPKVVLLIDSVIGPTEDDLEMLRALEEAGMEIVIVANKVDKIKKSQYRNQLEKLNKQFRGHKIFPYSSKSKIGVEELSNELLSNDSTLTTA
ncbi:MAG: ribosome biogenesis GTP-binding protein YihA/YsxC, partial [Candidatus Pacebacteria bacterium]|nr:ribosome biogenesis GTP-binding protein YihA/YsxC [Candidatus Paceibacterota bacterium]